MTEAATNPRKKKSTKTPTLREISQSESELSERGRERRERDLSQRESVRERNKLASLTPSEARLVRWLRQNLEMAGAAAVVKAYGTRTVLDALHDGIVHWHTPDPVEQRLGKKPGWEINRKLRSPSGFLRHILKQAHGKGRSDQ